MAKSQFTQLEEDLSTLGKSAVLSLSQRQKIRDQLFKKMGQVNLIDAVQTHTEVEDLVMPLSTLQRLFAPKRIAFGIPATAGMVLAVFVVTFATGAFAQSAKPGDPLFGIRKALETVQIVLTTDPANRATLKMNIVNSRIKALETADSETLSVALSESKKALASAQASLSSLPNDKDLNARLKTVIESQKATLSAIAKGNISNDEVKKTVLAMRNELDKLITPTTDKPAETTSAVAATKPTIVDDANRTNFYGGLTTSYGAPALFENGKAYVLAGVSIDLLPYVGSQSVAITGRLDGKTLTVTKITINNKLIWENTPDKDNNNLSWVEGDQNSSLR